MRLLELLLPSQDTDALLGDICEEARHRPRLWYWKQLLAAVVVGSWQDARRHPLLALRALATAIGTLTIYFTIVAAIARALWVLSNGGYYVGGYWLTLPARPIPERYDLLLVLVVNSLGSGISGWASTRFHRTYGIALAMPYLAIMGLLSLILITAIVTDTVPGRRVRPRRGGYSSDATILGSGPVSALGGARAGGRHGAKDNAKPI